METKQSPHKGYSGKCFPASTNCFALYVIWSLSSYQFALIEYRYLDSDSPQAGSSVYLIPLYLPNPPPGIYLDDTQDREHAHWSTKDQCTQYERYGHNGESLLSLHSQTPRDRSNRQLDSLYPHSFYHQLIPHLLLLLIFCAFDLLNVARTTILLHILRCARQQNHQPITTPQKSH